MLEYPILDVYNRMVTTILPLQCTVYCQCLQIVDRVTWYSVQSVFTEGAQYYNATLEYRVQSTVSPQCYNTTLEYRVQSTVSPQCYTDKTPNRNVSLREEGLDTDLRLRPNSQCTPQSRHKKAQRYLSRWRFT